MKQDDLLLKPFVSWCAAQGIVSPLEIRVRPKDGYRYVSMAEQQQNKEPPSANDPNRKGSGNDNSVSSRINLIQCPLNGKASLLADSMEELADRVAFEAFSLGQDSHFHPYLQVLPQEFPGMPRFWTSEHMDFVSQFDGGLLQSEHLSTASTSTDSSSSSWARAIVDSRANHLPSYHGSNDNDGDAAAVSSSSSSSSSSSFSYSLTPLLDMINHDGSVVTSAHVETSRSSSSSISSGGSDKVLHLDIQVPSDDGSGIMQVGHEEVKTSYGKLTNIELLLNYGFLEANGSNVWNRESLYVRTKSNPRRPILVTCHDKDGSIDRMSLSAVRKSLATKEELAVAERLLGRRTSFDVNKSSSGSETPSSMTMVPFLSKRNEEETYALIAGFLDDAVYKAKMGAQEALRIKATLETSSSSFSSPSAASSSSTCTILQYVIMADYLIGRARTLQNSLDRINVLLEHPQVFQAQEQALLF
jgi:hypothetical protein